MKKLLTIGLLMTLSLGTLMGCSGEETPAGEPENGNDTNSNKSGEKEPVELTLWVGNEDYAESLIEVLADELPHITFNWEEVGNNSALEKLSLDGPAGLGPDIMFVPHDHMALGVNQSLLLPLGEDLSGMLEGRFKEAALGTVKHNDTYFGVPTATESVALFYNKTLLDELGLEVATSFEEIIEQAEDYNDPRNNDFFLLFEGGNAYVNQIFLTAAGYQLFGPNHDEAGLVNLNSPEVVEGLTFYEKVSNILPIPAGDLNWDTTHTRFVDGEAPYMISGPWSFTDLHEEADFEWGVTTIPTINGVQPLTFAGYTIAVMSSYTNHPEEAREVMEFLASDQGIQHSYEVRGTIPALEDISGIPGVSEDVYSLGVLKQAEYSQPMPLIIEMDAFWAAAAPMYEAVWEGLSTPEEAAIKAQADFDAALQMQQ